MSTSVAHTSATTHNLVSNRLGRTMGVIGLVGLVAAAVLVALGLRMVDRTGATLARSLELTADAVTTVEETISVADESISVAASGLVTITDAVAGAEQSLNGAGVLLGETGVALADDIPAGIDAIRQTMPALIQSAQVLEDALGALSFLGIDFAPATPPADSLRRVESDLGAISDRLRDASSDLEDLGSGLAGLGAGAADLATELDRLQTTLQRADALLSGYASTTGRTAALVEQTSTELELQRSEGRLVVILLGVVIALGQAVPLTLAWHSRRSSDIEFETTGAG